VTFRDAIVKSRNIPTIKILQQIGVEQAKAYAKKLGYTSPLANNLTMALGSTGVSVEEQVAAFSTSPTGLLTPPHVKRIVTGQDPQRTAAHTLDDPLQPTSHRQKVLWIPASSRTGECREADERPQKKARRRNYYIMCSLSKELSGWTATVLKKIVGRPDIAGAGTTNNARCVVRGSFRIHLRRGSVSTMRVPGAVRQEGCCADLQLLRESSRWRIRWEFPESKMGFANQPRTGLVTFCRSFQRCLVGSGS
jgi:hypothetical protein